MTAGVVAVLVPYVISILLKVKAAFVDDIAARKTLSALVAFGNPPGAGHDSGGQQKVIITHLVHASLQSAAIMTAIVYPCAVVVVAERAQGRVPLIPAVLIGLFLSIYTYCWISWKHVGYFATAGKRAKAVFLLCLYDVVLAAMSVVAVMDRHAVGAATN